MDGKKQIIILIFSKLDNVQTKITASLNVLIALFGIQHKIGVIKKMNQNL